ncbi:MAG: barstar family protein [Chloroflexota bacterium]|nr:barstar family protein [Chloroflexota bacterium]
MNTRIADLLAGVHAPGLYRLRSRAAGPAIAAWADQGGWRFFRLDGQRIATKADLLAACAAAMDFPSTFGQNWDALADSLRDLSWAPAARGYLVLYDGVGRLASAQPQNLAVALDIFQDAVDFWRATPTPMTVLLRGTGRALRQIPWL